MFTDKLVHNVIFKDYYTSSDGTTSNMTTTVINGDKITKPATPTKKGYTFDYWSSLETGGGAYDFDVAIESETKITVTLYPYWTANNYTVKYDGNGATFGATPDSYHTYDTQGILSNNGFVKTGNKFLGWAKDKNATTPEFIYDSNNQCTVLNLTSEPDGVVTLYAIWQIQHITMV